MFHRAGLPAQIRVVFLADDPVMGKMVPLLLANNEDIHLINESPSFEQLPLLPLALNPHILLIEGGGTSLFYEKFLQAHQAYHQARIVLILTPTPDPYLELDFPPQLHGALFRHEVNEALVDLLRAVAHGATTFSRGVLEQLRRQQHSPNPLLPKIDHIDLNEREEQILPLLLRGWDRQMIAAEIGLAENTVRNYVRYIYAKLHVHSRRQLLQRFRTDR